MIGPARTGQPASAGLADVRLFELSQVDVAQQPIEGVGVRQGLDLRVDEAFQQQGLEASTFEPVAARTTRELSEHMAGQMRHPGGASAVCRRGGISRSWDADLLIRPRHGARQAKRREQLPPELARFTGSTQFWKTCPWMKRRRTIRDPGANATSGRYSAQQAVPRHRIWQEWRRLETKEIAVAPANGTNAEARYTRLSAKKRAGNGRSGNGRSAPGRAEAAARVDRLSGSSTLADAAA